MSIANPYLHREHPGNKGGLRLKRMAVTSSLTMACILIISKLTAFLITDSVSVLSSLMDSSFDAAASLVALLSIIHAASPADDEHRFGHGKIEAIAALGQAMFVFGSALFLSFESIHRFIEPQLVEDPAVGIGVMILSIFLTLCLVVFQKYVIMKTQSIAVSADHLHYKGDLLMNVGVLSALGLGYYSSWPYFDPIFALIISAILIKGAKDIGQNSWDILMDKELSSEERERIFDLVKRHPATKAVHDLRTRNTGERIFIEFHLEVDGHMSLHDAHKITEELEGLIYDAFPKAEVLIHQEPSDLDKGSHHRLDDNISAVKKSAV